MAAAAFTVVARWLPLAAAIVALDFTGFAVVQQVVRQAADYPQVQMAEDQAEALSEGRAPASLVADAVDIGRSLRPFIMVFDASGATVASEARLRGAPPELPAGVLDETAKRGEVRVTWAPQPDVRIAAVVRAAGVSGFVLAGRSLREVERTEDTTLRLAVLGGLAALGTSLATQIACALAALRLAVQLRA